MPHACTSYVYKPFHMYLGTFVTLSFIELCMMPEDEHRLLPALSELSYKFSSLSFKSHANTSYVYKTFNMHLVNFITLSFIGLCMRLEMDTDYYHYFLNRV